MKITFFTLFLLAIIGFESCRKFGNEPDIKQYDQQQITQYIAAKGISGMQKDTTNGDTTGTWFKILAQGNPAQKVDYPSTISYVYTIRSFDGKYAVTDTVLNHYYGILGNVAPNGLMLAIRNNLKYLGGQMRVLIPSHLAYGKNGIGSGSSTVTNNRIAGNQCLDVTVNLIGDQHLYDQSVIKNYMAANGLTGYSMTKDSLWYKITTPGTGAAINDNSSVNANYKLRLMNGTFVDTTYATTAYTFTDLAGGGITSGFVEGLKLVKNGGSLSIIVPSKLGYGTSSSGGVIPANACLRFDIYNVAVTNY